MLCQAFSLMYYHKDQSTVVTSSYYDAARTLHNNGGVSHVSTPRSPVASFSIYGLCVILYYDFYELLHRLPYSTGLDAMSDLFPFERLFLDQSIFVDCKKRDNISTNICFAFWQRRWRWGIFTGDLELFGSFIRAMLVQACTHFLLGAFFQRMELSVLIKDVIFMKISSSASKISSATATWRVLHSCR